MRACVVEAKWRPSPPHYTRPAGLLPQEHFASARSHKYLPTSLCKSLLSASMSSLYYKLYTIATVALARDTVASHTLDTHCTHECNVYVKQFPNLK